MKVAGWQNRQNIRKIGVPENHLSIRVVQPLILYGHIWAMLYGPYDTHLGSINPFSDIFSP